MEKLGEKIYSLRKERGLSQEELADALNVSRQSVSKWETDQSVPDYDNVAAMCAFFGVSLDGFTGNGAATAEAVMPVAYAEAAAAAQPENEAADKRLWKSIFLTTLLWFFAAVGLLTFVSFLMMAIVIGKDDAQFKTMIIPMLCVAYTVLFAVVFTVVTLYHKKNKKPRS